MLDLIDRPAIERAVGDPDGSKHKIIAILGSHPATVMQAPFGDESAYILACSPDNTPFGCTENRRVLPRVDCWAELHSPIEHPSRPYAYLNYVSTLPRVLMRDQRAMASGMFPNAVPYPEKEIYGTDVLGKSLERDPRTGRIAEVVRAYPAGGGLFNPWAFRSSIAWMLAKAIVDCEREKIPAIGLWGILQSSETEYEGQRQSTQYFLWEARRRGIEVLVAPESRLAEKPEDNW